MDAATQLTLSTWGGGFLLIASAVWMSLKTRRAEKLEKMRMQEVIDKGLHIPASLHPVIDADTCISSGACVASCPEGDVLGIISGKGVLIRGASCIGHGRCAIECPVDAIKLVFGTEERGVDIPSITPQFETNRAGIYIAGELGGMGLIKNAIRQGVGAARHSLKGLKASLSDNQLDVLIVGAGPAGIGAGLACLEAGASYRLIEQDTIGGTVAHYPRQKVVMSEPIKVPLFGTVHKARMVKEDLIALWHQIIGDTGLEVQTGVKLTDVTGESGDFTVTTSAGELKTKKIILAIGRRGTPRKLGVPGEELEHVTYRLIDPTQYEGSSVLIVGGGDSALEAACVLADPPSGQGAARKVTISYRSAGFSRAKQANREHIEQLEAAGKITVLFETNVTEIAVGKAQLKGGDGRWGDSVDADYIIVQAGGELPTKFLDKLGIRTDKWFGERPEGAPDPTHIAAPKRKLSMWGIFGYSLFALAILGLFAISWIGRDYYSLDLVAREDSPLHANLRPSGPWGHGIGVLATLFMLGNFMYAARKRLKFMQRFGRIQSWLTAHVLLGLLAPCAILFHAAFKSENQVATATYAAIIPVLITGIIGRYVYGKIQSGGSVRHLKRFMRVWRVIHVVLAVLMVVVIMAHIGIAILMGQTWIF